MTDLVIEAEGVSKTFGSFQALKGVNLKVPLGRIVGVIGSNGAGKTTLLNAILGLSTYEGTLRVLGLDPSKSRDDLMKEVCFISDVATLPKWMKVSDVLDFVERVHPGFEREKAESFLARTTVPMDRKVKALSKGMTVQVHLAVVMAIDAKLLVLDEPTLGLDILFRKEFYKTLLEEYFDEERTILINTHQVEEVEHILTDVIFIRDGDVALASDMDTLAEDFAEVMINPGQEDAARALSPVATGQSFGKTTCVFRGVSFDKLRDLGETRRMGLADIFVTVMKGGAQ